MIRRQSAAAFVSKRKRSSQSSLLLISDSIRSRLCVWFVLFIVVAVFIAFSLYRQIILASSSSLTPRSTKNHQQNEAITRAVANDMTAAAAAAGQNIDEERLILSEVRTEVLVLNTRMGPIRIRLRPDLSPESVEYIHRVLLKSAAAANSEETETETGSSCKNCRLYRAEKPGILQGVFPREVELNHVKGSCPSEAAAAHVHNHCPEWDTECACHGPVMTHGMVGWAAGKTGPDFFMDLYKKPADWWGTQHTVWGIIEDSESFSLIDQIWDLPTKKSDGLTFLQKPLHFTVELQYTS